MGSHRGYRRNPAAKGNGVWEVEKGCRSVERRIILERRPTLAVGRNSYEKCRFIIASPIPRFLAGLAFAGPLALTIPAHAAANVGVDDAA